MNINRVHVREEEEWRRERMTSIGKKERMEEVMCCIPMLSRAGSYPFFSLSSISSLHSAFVNTSSRTKLNVSLPSGLMSLLTTIVNNNNLNNTKDVDGLKLLRKLFE